MKYILLIIIVFVVSCTNENAPEQKVSIIQTDTTKNKVANSRNTKLSAANDTNSIKDSSLVTISGDFNGDGIIETLQEHYFSKTLNKEVPVPHSNGDIDNDSLFNRVIELDPTSYLTCSNNLIDTLHITNSSPLFGLYYIKNEGDLDGDKGDEVSLVVAWLQYSTTNICYIVSYKNDKWIELYSFPTWSWAVDDEIDKGGLIKKLPGNKIEVKYRTDDADQDTKIIDLSKLTPNYQTFQTW